MDAKGLVSTIATWMDKEMIAKIEEAIHQELPRCAVAGVEPYVQRKVRYLDKRLDQVIDKLPVDFDADAPLSSAVETPLGDESILSQAEAPQKISDDEIDTFRNFELNRLDNLEYFREIFG